MSHLLITTLGRASAQPGRYRLPVGDRIVETSFLGLELAPIIDADSVHFVAADPGAFASLLDLLPADVLARPVPEEPPAKAPQQMPAESPDTADEASSETPPAAEPAAEVAGEVTEAPAETSAETQPASDAPASTDDSEAPPPQATAEEEPAAEPASADKEPAAPTPTAEKHHEPDPTPMADRVRAMANSHRADRDALKALSDAIREAKGFKDVRCVLISDPTEGRSFQAAMRTLVDLPRDGDQVTFDVSNGPRMLPTTATMAMWYFMNFRPEIQIGTIFHASEEADASGSRHVNPLEGPFEMLAWMEVFKGLHQGRAPRQLHQVFNHDRRLQPMAGPYVRFQRGVQFGALSEVQEGAKLVEQQRRGLRRLPYAHPFRMFDKVVGATMKRFLHKGNRHSSVQLQLGREAMENGLLPQAALHARESLLSYCLESYERSPTKAWIDVPDSGGAQRVRPREIAGFILGCSEAQAKAPELTTVWPLLQTARNRYVNTSPTPVSPSQLRDEDNEIHKVMELCAKVIERNALEGIKDELEFEAATKRALDLTAVRPRDSRGRPARRRRKPSGQGGDGRSGPQGERPKRGPRPAGGGPSRPPRERRRNEDPADSTPRVRRAAQGALGNLGLALAQAGLTEGGGKKSKKRKRSRNRKSGPKEAQSTETNPAPTEASPPELPPSAPDPEMKTSNAPEAPPSAPAQETSPPPTAPETAADPKGQDPTPDFDVAGPDV